jgi:hypothetical protein
MANGLIGAHKGPDGAGKAALSERGLLAAGAWKTGKDEQVVNRGA